MKIGMCGAQATGKTTHAEMLRGYTLVPSPARHVVKEGFPVNRSGTLSSQIVIAGKMELDMKRNEKVIDLVYERTHVDCYAYTTNAAVEPVKNEMLAVIKELARKQIKDYFDLVFYFPAYDINNFVAPDDGVRDCDEDYRQYIDGVIKDLLSDINADYITVPCGSIKSVHEFIEEHIRDRELSIQLESLKIIKKSLLKNLFQ